MAAPASRLLLAATVAFAAALAVAPVGGSSVVMPGAAHAEVAELPSVGARLVAVVDVELDAAVVRAGSHVSVVGRKEGAGRVMFDVALADGHVVRGVPLQRLRTSFRVV